MALSRLRAVLLGLVGLVVVGVVWDLYKSFGPDDGWRIGDKLIVLPRASDLAMPHTWEIVQRLKVPSSSMDDAPSTFGAVVDASTFTLEIAAKGWLIGVVVGLLLAVLMSRLRVAESALLPWIVLSQTVPLIAVAPLVKKWGDEFDRLGYIWTDQQSVAVIAAYLAFFPVSVGALRGLKSPEATHLDLMHAYGLGWWRTLLRLRLPASVPFLLPALRLGAASAVIGTVVAEVSIGLQGGLGRMIIEYASSGSSDPAKPWAPILGSVAVGLVAAGVVGLLGLLLRRYRTVEIAS